jgi:hypothetical protein
MGHLDLHIFFFKFDLNCTCNWNCKVHFSIAFFYEGLIFLVSFNYPSIFVWRALPSAKCTLIGEWSPPTFFFLPRSAPMWHSTDFFIARLLFYSKKFTIYFFEGIFLNFHICTLVYNLLPNFLYLPFKPIAEFYLKFDLWMVANPPTSQNEKKPWLSFAIYPSHYVLLQTIM